MNRLMCGLLLGLTLLTACAGNNAPQPATQPSSGGEGTSEPTAPIITEPSTEASPGTVESSTEEAANVTPTVDINCTATNPHPIGQGIAQTYQTSYEEVMTFFCTGVSFEDITTAYQTARVAGITVQEALTLWYDLESWDEVWSELGIQ